MPTDVRVELQIARPRDNVAAYAFDWTNDVQWIGAVTEAQLLTEPPLRAGSRVLRVATFLGSRLEYVNEVVEYEPPVRLVMSSVEAPFPMRITYVLDESPSGATTFRIRAEGDARGFYRLAAPLLAQAVRRSITKDLERLKVILETAPPRDPPS
ncbi:MAG TPA: SRPBCC family protein [Gaiellaceae bacterium]|nr:SRPBCC family protein [Gaiellaceae bacterium]